MGTVNSQDGQEALFSPKLGGEIWVICGSGSVLFAKAKRASFFCTRKSAAFYVPQNPP